MWKRAPAAAVVVAVALVTLALSGEAGRGTSTPARRWARDHAALVRDLLVAVNTVPVDPRRAGPAAMATSCRGAADAGAAMHAALPAPARDLTRAWSAVADDVGVVARFCLDAAARGDRAMLDEVPNYLALTGRTLDRLREVTASFGPSL